MVEQFEVGKTYKNGRGGDVLIVANNLSGSYSLLAVVTETNGIKSAMRLTSNGLSRINYKSYNEYINN